MRTRRATLTIIFLVVLVYLPAWDAGFIWDDNDHVTENPTLRTTDGLARIWTDFDAIPRDLPQYYPLTFTAFWAEYQLWHTEPTGYHLVNILLHALNAILLWRVLRALGVPGAWVAGAVFGLHPVHVMSVAWITELKNVLSGAFFLSSLLLFLHFEPGATGRRRFYAASLALFLCALLSKTATASLPVALLLIAWWKRPRLSRADLVPLLPFFALGFFFIGLTVWLETTRVGASGALWNQTPVERFLLAGHAVWFYAGKLLFPRTLLFLYPSWRLAGLVAWLYPLAALAVLYGLWRYRSRIGKAPFAAVLFFVLAVAPMAFSNVFMMQYTPVSDHWQYLASLSLIAGTVALAAQLTRRFPVTRRVLAVLLLVALGWRTWVRADDFKNNETVWRTTLAGNPTSWLAHNNLGLELFRTGRTEEAIEQFSASLAANPDYAYAHSNLGAALLQQGKAASAERSIRVGLERDPAIPGAERNLGLALLAQGRAEEAEAAFQAASALDPDDPVSHYYRGRALVALKREPEAAAAFQEALRLDPAYHRAQEALESLGSVRSVGPD